MESATFEEDTWRKRETWWDATAQIDPNDHLHNEYPANTYKTSNNLLQIIPSLAVSFTTANKREKLEDLWVWNLGYPWRVQPSSPTIFTLHESVFEVQLLEVQFRSLFTFVSPTRWVPEYLELFITFLIYSYKKSQNFTNVPQRDTWRDSPPSLSWGLPHISCTERWAYRISHHLQLIFIFRGRRCYVHSVVIRISGLRRGTR